MPQASPVRRPRRGFGRIARLPSKRFRARYLGPDGQLYSAPDSFSARIDAEAWLAAMERTISRGDWQPPAPPSLRGKALRSFRDYALNDVQGRTLTPRTRELYERQLERLILPHFGETEVEKITTTNVRAWYAQLCPEQPTQRAHAYALLRSILSHAVDDERITANPCHIRSATSRRRMKNVEPAKPDDLARLQSELQPRFALPILIAGWCGLRSGEVRALRVKDVDVVGGWIRVRQGVTRISGQVLVGPPKTPASVRDVAVPPHLLPSIKTWIEHLPEGEAERYLFPGREPTAPMSEKALRHAFAKAKELIDRPDMTFHDLRHTAATLAAQNGATTAELMRRLGHTSASMAMRYQHSSAQRDRQIAEALSSLLKSEEK